MGLTGSATATLDRGVAFAIAAAERGAVLALRATLSTGPGSDADRLASPRLLGTKGARPAVAESRAGALSTLSIAASPAEFRAVRDRFAAHPLREDPLRDPWLTKPARHAVQDDWTGTLEDLSFLVMSEGDGPLANLQVAIRLTALCLACQRPAPPPEFHDRLRRGEAQLYVGTWTDEPVSGLIVGRHGATSYYESGLSLRRGNAPLSHALLANAMIDAAQAGQRRFFLGALHVDPSFDSKLRSIAAFKKGFTRTTRPLTWTAVPVGG
ncbi:MAG: hypothetical protein HQL42_06905 [Alphaproteobacteria bacterium]|nr:hypothetical protein [Alphaproteobacteria bacterium]